MSQKRFLIVLTEGSFQGASMTDDREAPVPLELADLAAHLPAINAAALAEVESLKSALAAAPTPEGLAAKDARIAELTAELEALRNPPASGGVTKLTIMRRLGDKWPRLKAILAGMPELVQDAWALAQEIRADDPLFQEHAEALRAALGLSDAEFAALLAP